MEGLSIIFPAFIAGLLIIITHVPLGMEVMRRGIIFIDLAIAQIAGIGIVAVSVFFHVEDQPIVGKIVGLCFALIGAYFFMICEKRFKKYQEAIIGSTYVISVCFTFLIVANHAHGMEEVENILSGQLLFVNWQQIVITFTVYFVLVFFIFSKKILEKYFYYIFAIAITISVQLGGVFFVFASLVMPSIAIFILKKDKIYGYLISVLALVIGLLISLFSDLPTGPVLVISLGALVSSAISYQTLIKKIKN